MLIESDRDLCIGHHIMKHVVVLEEVAQESVPVVVVRSEFLDKVGRLTAISSCFAAPYLHVLLVQHL